MFDHRKLLKPITLKLIMEENKNCPCPYSCPRHGKCDECQEYHQKCNDKTYCGK